MEKFSITEYEIYTIEPEALNVGQLNKVVRELREIIYQLKIEKQKLQTKIDQRELKLNIRLDACLYSMVLMQSVIRDRERLLSEQNTLSLAG